MALHGDWAPDNTLNGSFQSIGQGLDPGRQAVRLDEDLCSGNVTFSAQRKALKLLRQKLCQARACARAHACELVVFYSFG